MKLNLPKDRADLTKKLAFLAVFGVTGVVAVATYKYVKKKLDVDFNLDDIDWGL